MNSPADWFTATWFNVGRMAVKKKNNIIVAVVSIFLLAGIILVSMVGTMLPSVSSVSSSADDQFVMVNKSKMRFKVYDKGGKPIIFLHGFGGDLTTWEPLIQSMRCGRLFGLDLIGFGLSDRPDINYSLELQSQYLLSFMDKVGIKNAILSGTSMGASLALWTASKYPNRIDGICAFAPSAYPGSMRHRWPGDLIYRPNMLNAFLGKMASTEIYKWLFPRSLARQALNVTASYDKTFVEALKKIKQPVLLVWSESDQRVPYSYNLVYKELLPQAQFLQAPAEAGHSAARFPLPEITEWLCQAASATKN